MTISSFQTGRLREPDAGGIEEISRGLGWRASSEPNATPGFADNQMVPVLEFGGLAAEFKDGNEIGICVSGGEGNTRNGSVPFTPGYFLRPLSGVIGDSSGVHRGTLALLFGAIGAASG